MKNFLVASTALLSAGIATAATIAIDGTAEVLYGAPKSVQSIQTQFGDNNVGNPVFCNGSELDGLYASVQDGFLHMTLTGNLQTNWNKLVVFLDCRDGGQNRVRGDNNSVDYNGLNNMGDDGSGNGLTFDDGFAADYFIGVTCGIGDVGQLLLYVNYADMPTLGAGDGGFAGPGTGAQVPVVTPNGIEVAVDNRNVLGVTGGPGGASSGEGVTTGVEMKIPLPAIGWTAGSIKVCAFVNGGGYSFMSNQVLGSLPVDSVNLGNPRAVSFASIPGDQFVVAYEGGTPPDPCPADLDNDNVVSGSDLSTLLGSWGPCSGACPADLDADGVVSGADLSRLLGAWGPCP